MTAIVISSLKNQAAFDLANKIGKKQNGRFFILISHRLEASEANTLYLGLKISRKLGKAVVRNKIRRRIKGLMRGITHKLSESIWGARVFMLIPRRGFDEADYSEIEKDLTWHVKKNSE